MAGELLKIRNDKLLSECLGQEHNVAAHTLLEEISVQEAATAGLSNHAAHLAHAVPEPGI